MVVPNTGVFHRYLKRPNASDAMKADFAGIESTSIHHKTYASNTRWPFQALLEKSHVLTALVVVETGVAITLVRQPSHRW